MALTPAGGVPISNESLEGGYILAEVGGNTRRVSSGDFTSIANMAASTKLFDGQTVYANGEAFTYDATSTATADGALIVTATGMGVGRLISKRKTLVTVAELLDGDLRGYETYSAGDDVVAEGERYKVAAIGATDQNETTAGGVKLYYVGAVVRKTGGTAEPNNALMPPAINKIADHAEASHIQGGTTGLPMFIGWEYDFQTVVGDGVTTVFNFTVPFVVPDESWSARVASINDADNLYFPVSATITGYGTSTITITLGSALAVGRTLYAQFLGANGDPATQARLCFILGGYNNVANGLMDIVIGAHNRTIGPDDHNTISGGSNNLIVSGAYGTITGGTNVVMGLNASGTGMTGGGSGIRVDEDGATAFGLGSTANGRGATAIGLYAKALAGGSTAIGQSLSVSGVGSAAFGKGNTSSGLYSTTVGLDNINAADYGFVSGRDNAVDGAADYTFVAGQGHDVDFAWASVFGYKARNFNPGHHARGYNGAAAGDRQAGEIGLYKQSTSNVNGYLAPLTGSTRVVFPNDSVVSITGRVIAKEVGGTDCAMFEVDCLALQNGGTTAIKFGGAATVLFADTGAAAWALEITGSANGVLVKENGDVGKTINWFAELKIENCVG